MIDSNRLVSAARDFLKHHGPETAFGWMSTVVAAGSWVYTGTLGLAFTLHWRSDQLDPITEWVALPVQFLALVLLVSLLCSGSRLPKAQRSAWWCVLAFTALSPLATYVWNTAPRQSNPEVVELGDVIYFVDYWTLTAAFALLFMRAGGSFREVRAWLDAATMTAVQLVGVWAFFLGPSIASGAVFGISFTDTLEYSLTLACMMTMGAMLCLQLPSYRGSISVLLLVAGGAVTAAWEIMWLASWLTDRDFVGPFYNFGDVLCFAAVSSAIAATQFRAPLRPETNTPHRRAESFLPALSVLVAIALVAGSVATTRRWDAWVLVVLVVLCALLLITRQQSVRREMQGLNRRLAQREADGRLTELVRRSSDLILLVNRDGRVSFASPSTESILGKSSAQLLSTQAFDVFGQDYSVVLAAVLDRVRAQPETPLIIELRVRRPGEEPRVIKLNAANRLDNQLIDGIVLTLTDITEQRMLEREVIDVASRERMRLSGDIHDGLGQELFGISMLLQAAVTSPHPDPAVQISQLRTILGHINRALTASRDLARGLSPLQVVRGSLSAALKRLAQESNTPVSVRLDVGPAFDEEVIDDFCAEHLYRIAQEAVTNAMCHSFCSNIDITLRRTAAAIELCVTDDGRGIHPSSAYPGLGLRLMEYRARILGGTLRVSDARGSGTRVEVVTPVGGEKILFSRDPVPKETAFYTEGRLS